MCGCAYTPRKQHKLLIRFSRWTSQTKSLGGRNNSDALVYVEVTLRSCPFDIVWMVCFYCKIWDTATGLISSDPFSKRNNLAHRERSGSVIVCLTLDRGAKGSSLIGVTVINPSLVLVQPRKNRPFI